MQRGMGGADLLFNLHQDTSPPKGRFVLRADAIRPYSGVCALNRVLAKIQRFGRMLCPYKVLFNAVSER